jgi:hypothetical protein
MIDFHPINRAAVPRLPAIVQRCEIPGVSTGTQAHSKSILRLARGPISPQPDRGGDPVSLCAYVEGVSQGEAARLLARMLAIDVDAG